MEMFKGLEHLLYKEWLRLMGLFKWEETKGGLVHVYICLMGILNMDPDSSQSSPVKDKRQGQKYEKFLVNI